MHCNGYEMSSTIWPQWFAIIKVGLALKSTVTQYPLEHDYYLSLKFKILITGVSHDIFFISGLKLWVSVLKI